MIWDAAGAVAVATVRTWLKSGRWDAAIGLRPRRQRAYHRRIARGTRAACPPLEDADGPVVTAVEEPPPAHPRGDRTPAPTGQIAPTEGAPNAAPADPAATHPWRKPWSVRQQRRLAAAQVAAAEPARAA